ncbi:enhancer of Polycomb isoform X2 [Oratosquilla oratoria]|uniref:enhancer of Polycomb isoform X2 n=1 Tax=Oratosquilla oratoria TaxID=337810 RepID=UPI003F768E6D
MSKFRARQLDASKPIPVYLQEEIPDIAEFNAINRTVPQMPTGMEKEEETEHHLQQAIFHQRVIPVPEVYDTTQDPEGARISDKVYPPTYKAPRQLIHVHPFSVDQDIPEYDMDSEDEAWVNEHAAKGEVPLTNLQFEEMMDRLEKASGLKAVTLQEAKLLLKDDDDLIIAVYDYWLNKRLREEHALIPQVKVEKGAGSAPSDPYVAFRKRTEKMQTRKNRKNDESSYEKMLKLRRDLSRAVTLLEMVKRREKAKREHLNLNIEIFERRYEIQDFNGAILAEVTALRAQRPAFAPLFSNHQISTSASASAGGSIGSAGGSASWIKSSISSHSSKEDGKRERRSYRKRRRQNSTVSSSSASTPQLTPTYTHPPDPYTLAASYPQDPLGLAPPSSEDEVASPSPSEAEEENEPDGTFTFRRKKFCNYHAPASGNWPWVHPNEGGGGDRRFRFCLTSLPQPKRTCIGFGRRRMGRGGRIWIDRISTPLDDIWSKMDFKDVGPNGLTATNDFLHEVKTEWPHYCPSSPPEDNDTDVEIDVETVGVPVTLSPDVVNLNSSSTNNGEEIDLATTSTVPSSVFITAEVLEGESVGMVTDLEVTVPSEWDDLLAGNSSGVILGDGLEVDILTDVSASSVAESDSGSEEIKGTGNGGLALTAGDGGRGSSGKTEKVDLEELSDVEWAWSSRMRLPQVHSSHDFNVQPSSKFLVHDSTSIVPLAVSGLEISTSNVTGEAGTSTSSQSISSSTTTITTTTITTTNTNTSSSSSSLTFCTSSGSSFTTSSTTSTSISSSTSSIVTSLSNSVMCASQSGGSIAVDRNSGTAVSDNDLESKMSSSSSSSSSCAVLGQQQDACLGSKSLPSGLLLSNNKNNGSNVISSSNNLVSQKLYAASRTNDSLPNSESNGSNSNNSTVLANGPNNSLDGSKCAKVDNFMFHET